MDEIEYIWYVDEETWDWLIAWLDEEPVENPKLKDLMERRAPWET